MRNTISPASTRFYVTGGTLPANAISYIERDADSLLLRGLLQGEFCYILTSRQMGKSSLMTRMARRLREHGARAAVVDLSGQGFDLDAQQWYNGLLHQIAASLGLEAETEAFRRSHIHLSPLKLWQQTLRDVVLMAGAPEITTPITIFIDEIDVVHNLKFATDEFFAAIRAYYNARAEYPAYGRLNFCLLGVSTPAELIANISLTPFNIGTSIELRDFTRSEVCLLENGLGRSRQVNNVLMDRIFYWTSGHPYLTQRLCLAVAENRSRLARRCVDSCVEQLFLSANSQREDRNIQFVNQRMLPTGDEVKAGLLTLYASILNGAGVTDFDTTAHVAALKLAGIVCAIDGKLKVRNRIYSHVFDRRWIADKMPGAERRRQQAAYRRGQIRATAAASAILAAMGLLTVWALRAQNRADWYRIQADKANATAQQRLKDARHSSYTLSMNLIQREWDLHNINRVLDMLESTRNSEYRGFEWGYWNNLCHLDLLTLRNHAGTVNAVAFSRDGKLVATGCHDKKIRIWDVHSGHEILCFDAALVHDGRMMPGVTSVAFAPDGNRLAAACDGSVAIWDSQTGKRIWAYSTASRSAYSVAYSADGKRIAAGVNIPLERGASRPGNRALKPIHDDPSSLPNQCDVKEWDAASGRELLTLYGRSVGVKAVSFSRDGTRIAAGSYDQTATIWNARTGQQLLEITDATHVITSVDFSPDGFRLVTGLKRVFEPENGNMSGESPDDSTVKVWDAFTGRELLRLRGYTSTVKSAVFSSDGKQIATAGYDATARLWDATTGAAQIVFRGHTNRVVAAAFSTDGKRLVTGSTDRTARIWDFANYHQSLAISEHEGRVTSVALSADGRLLITGSGCTPATWDPTTGRENVTYPDTPPKLNGKDACGTAEIRSARSGAVLFRLTGHQADVTSAAFSPDGNRAVTGSYDGTSKVWNTSTGREMLELVGHRGAVTSAAFSCDGNLIVTGSLDGTAKIWNSTTGHETLTLKGHAGPVSSAAFSPDGKRVVTGSWDKTAKLWDASSGRELRSFSGHNDEVYAVAFSPDGTTIVTGSTDNTAIVWSVTTGAALYTLRGHTDNVNSVAFSPDGRRIITGSDDHTAIVWDAETGEELLTLMGHTRAIHGVCFSPDGRDVITGSWDKTIRVWHAVF